MEYQCLILKNKVKLFVGVMMKKKMLVIFSIIAILFLPSATYAEQKTIRVVMDDNYPPYSFLNAEGELIGITIDQWNLFSEKNDIKVELTGMDWNLAQSKMNDGEFDVIDTIFKNEEREKIYSFTESYADIDTSIYFQNNISGIVDLQSTRGFSIATKSGGHSVTVLKEAGISNYNLYSSYEDMISAASQGEIVMFIMENPPAQYYMYKLNIQDKFNFTEPIYSNSFYRAVKIGNDDLLGILNAGFNAITDEEYKSIDEKWFGKSSGIEKGLKNLIIYLVVGFSALMILLLLTSFFLKRQVSLRTRELNNSLMDNIGLNDRLNAILKSIPDLIFILDKNAVFIEAPFSEDKMPIYDKDEFIGKTFSDLFPQTIADKFLEAFEEFCSQNITEPLEYNLMELGDDSFYELRFRRVNDNRILAIIRDITEQKKIQSLIYELGVKDSLTNVYNRNYFERIINDIDIDNENYGVLICDVDALKLVNDTFGHHVGDEYLKTISSILRSHFVEDELIARIGGDEFAVIIPNSSLEELEMHKQEIKKRLLAQEKEYSFLDTNISVGYAFKNSKDVLVHDLIKEADREMYREKTQHKYSQKNGNIAMLMNMLETRNFETSEHAQRLGKYGSEVSRRLEMTESFINKVVLLGEFHDIGKIGISDQILLKPGKLTPDEFEEMKKHSEIGYRIAKSLTDLEHVADLIYKHHEWFDGNGYPFGLSGINIPLECRIISVIDAYDAMVNDRTYRPALSKTEALEELIRYKGTQFDPEIVDIFLKVINEQ